MAAWIWLDAWLDRKHPAALVFGVVHLALALHARPEVWVVAPALLLSLPTLEHRWGRLLQDKRPLFLGIALLALLAGPRLVGLLQVGIPILLEAQAVTLKSIPQQELTVAVVLAVVAAERIK